MDTEQEQNEPSSTELPEEQISHEDVDNTGYKKKRWGTIVLLYIIIAMVVYAGYYYYANAKKETKAPEVTQPSPTEVIDQTANWKTYTSTKANYSFKYPSSWPINTVGVNPQCTSCIENLVFSPSYNQNSGDTNIAVIIVSKESNIKTLDDYVNIHVKGDPSKINLQHTSVGGEKAVSYTLSGGIPPLPIIEYAVVKNGFSYIIRLDDSSETNKDKTTNMHIFNQVLFTFQFIDQKQNTKQGEPLTFQKLKLTIPSAWWSKEFETSPIGSKSLVINPSKLPEPSDAMPAFRIEYDENKTIAQETKDLLDIKGWGLTNVTQQDITLEGRPSKIIQGTTRPGMLDSHTLKVYMIQDGTNLYYLEDHSQYSDHEKYFAQITSSFTFNN